MKNTYQTIGVLNISNVILGAHNQHYECIVSIDQVFTCGFDRRIRT